jgi:hypothetical protein
MNRIRLSLGALVLVIGTIGAPAANSVFAQSSAPRAAHTHQGVTAYVASVVGVTPTVLQQDLQAGQTLLQIAGTRFPSADALATTLLAPLKSQLDKAVSANKLTPSREAAIYSALHARVAQLVVTPHPSLAALFGRAHGARQGGARPHIGRLGAGLLTSLTTTCKTTTAGLRTAFQTGGMTILAICQTTNPSITQSALVNALSAPLQAKLDAAVAARKITAAQESAMLAAEKTFLTKLVTTPLPAGGLHHR